VIPDSAAELDAYNELYCYALAHEDPAFIRQLVVDAWMAQNANEQTKPIGLTFALVGLYLHVERGFSGLQVHQAHRTMSRVKSTWPPFPLPKDRGSITASSVMAAPPGPERDEAIDAWCQSVWAAFRESREVVAGLVAKHGITGPT